jgi:hypothetical protein
MYFNRFDICEAYYMFGYLYHSGMNSYGFRLLSRLANLGFSPRDSLRSPEDLEENSREIFNNLVANQSHYHSLSSNI